MTMVITNCVLTFTVMLLLAAIIFIWDQYKPEISIVHTLSGYEVRLYYNHYIWYIDGNNNDAYREEKRYKVLFKRKKKND